ncbi:Universal stress protein A [Labeo rohita]|uniref:Universal stress protein A n=1 Tax=Labeo rohita TaxID=84645 RepID=A0ABQ8L6J6_LABRO|nr:Universal stress protein A [Labeo rohita]
MNSQSDPLNLSAKLSIDGKDYTIFISSDSMRCFVCDKPARIETAAPVANAENSERAALLENDTMDSEPASGGMTKLYSVQQINNFLDVTKGLRKPKIESYFPDLKVFLLSGTMAMRKASFDELDKPKRYRLKKLLSNVRSSLNVQGKK